MIDLLANIPFVIKNSRLVRINEKAITNFVNKINPKKIQYQKNPLFDQFSNDEEKANFIFFFSLVNFGLWGLSFKKNRTENFLLLLKKIYQTKKNNHLKQFLIEVIPIFSQSFDDKITDLFLSLRINVLKETAIILSRQPFNSFSTFIEKNDFDALKIIENLAKIFPSFDDSSYYQGKKINFFKRSQILASLINTYCHSFRLKKTELLTVGADYRLPQILRFLNILEFKKDLAMIIDHKKIIAAESKKEIEIRANTIWSVELIKKKLKILHQKNIPSYIIDNYLWQKSRKVKSLKNHHRVITIFY